MSSPSPNRNTQAATTDVITNVTSRGVNEQSYTDALTLMMVGFIVAAVIAVVGTITIVFMLRKKRKQRAQTETYFSYAEDGENTYLYQAQTKQYSSTEREQFVAGKSKPAEEIESRRAAENDVTGLQGIAKSQTDQISRNPETIPNGEMSTS